MASPKFERGEKVVLSPPKDYNYAAYGRPEWKQFIENNVNKPAEITAVHPYGGQETWYMINLSSRWAYPQSIIKKFIVKKATVKEVLGLTDP